LKKSIKSKIIIILISVVSIFVVAIVALLAVHSQLKQKIPHPDSAADIWNKKAIDSAVTLLHSGYMVLRMGRGADSYMLAQLNQKDKSFSHCGIVFIENGYPFVYHCIGGEDNPDERLRRDSACFFFSQVHNLAMAVVNFEFSDAQTQRLKSIVYDYYKKRPKFDLQFDLKTDDKLYCAEFVYKAINQAVDDTAYIQTTTLMGCTFVGIDNLFLNQHAHIIWQTKFK